MNLEELLYIGVDVLVVIVKSVDEEEPTEPENTEEPDTENPYVADEKPYTEKPYLENPYVYNKPEKRKTRVNITSSSLIICSSCPQYN